MLSAPSLTRSLSAISDTPDLPTEAGKTSFHTLDSQVGGHAGVLSNEDGSLIIKPALPAERHFYELLAQSQMKEDDENDGVDISADKDPLRILASLTPKFLGTLRLEGATPSGTDVDINTIASGSTTIVPPPEGEAKDDIVLENISGTFSKPNIIDIKLGTILYDDEASEEKKARMTKTAMNTTSFETGVRLTGFQVYDYTKNIAINTPKSYGKSISVADLPEGIRRFFPISSSMSIPQGQGLPRDILLRVLRGILHDIKTIHLALSTIELRMVGGSLLIVYEADWEVARSAIEAVSQPYATIVPASFSTSTSHPSGVAREEREISKDLHETGEISQDDSDVVVGVEKGEEDDDNVSSEEEDDEENDSPSAYAVKLIDFAHTKLTPGEGPDLGVLKGIETVIRLLEGRIAELGSVSDSSPSSSS